MFKNLFKTILLTLLTLSFLGILSTKLALAQEPAVQGILLTQTMPTIPKPALLPGPNEEDNAKEVQQYFRNKAIPSFTEGFIGLVGGMALIALVWSGIRFITAAGEEEAITSAKKTATWAVIGFVIAILSYAIVSIMTSIQYPAGTTPTGAPAEEESVIYQNN